MRKVAVWCGCGKLRDPDGGGKLRGRGRIRPPVVRGTAETNASRAILTVQRVEVERPLAVQPAQRGKRGGGGIEAVVVGHADAVAAADRQLIEQPGCHPVAIGVALSGPARAASSTGGRATLDDERSLPGVGQHLAGEVSGPAVRLTVRLTNGTDQPLDLSYVAVNAYVGPDRIANNADNTAAAFVSAADRGVKTRIAVAPTHTAARGLLQQGNRTIELWLQRMVVRTVRQHRGADTPVPRLAELLGDRVGVGLVRSLDLGRADEV